MRFARNILKLTSYCSHVETVCSMSASTSTEPSTTHGLYSAASSASLPKSTSAFSYTRTSDLVFALAIARYTFALPKPLKPFGIEMNFFISR